MRSNELLDREIKSTATIINAASGLELNSPAAAVAFAVYTTLQWARGCRVPPPSRTAQKAIADRDKEAL